jgi:AraC-like DNA-binding protein
MVTLDEAGRGVPSLRFIAPPADLAGIVEHIWVEENSASTRRGWRIVPDDAPHVLWHEYASRAEVHVVGARSHFVDIDKANRVRSIGVRLLPGALPALFRCSAEELTDRTVRLRDVASARLAAIVDGGPNIDAHRLQALLRACAERGRAIDRRVVAFLRLTRVPAIRLHTVARELGVSERTLRLMARDGIGLRARDVVRVRRLHVALEHGLAAPGNWSRAAATAGYVDQAHLTHDCRALLGETPGAFAARALGI